MDERNVLVADALDVVLAVAVVEHRGALDGLDSSDPGTVISLEPFAGGQCSRRPGGSHEGSQPKPGPLGLVVEVKVLEGSTSHLVVADVVGELGELVEDEVAGILGQLVTGVVDLLDVAF